MKTKFFTIILSFLLFLCQKSFSQVTYPCGVYFIGMNGTSTDGGAWNQVYNSPDITLAAWIQLTDATYTGRRMEIFNRYDFSSGENTDISLAINESGEVVFKARITGASQLFDSVLFNLKPVIGKWYHVAVTFAGAGQCNTYVNGKPANSKGFAGPLSYINTGSAYSHYMTFGFKDGKNAGYSNFFKGYLDEAAYCQKALTASEVEALARGIAPGDPFIKDKNVAVYHKFDDYPSQPNYGTYGGTLPTSGQYYYCPAKLITSIIDPNPNMILDDGSLSKDLSKINLNAVVQGAATDGVTKLLLVADATLPITFSLANPKDGILYSLDDQHTLTTQISITPKNGKAVCVYEVPDGYGVNNPPGRSINVQASYTSDNSHQTDLKINLFTPPVVLVHGMWSGPEVWGISNGYVAQLENAKFPFPPFLADYKNWGASTFDPFSPNSIYGRGAVQSAINDGLKTYRNKHIAVTQTDVVGHSLGGLMARSFSQQGPSFLTKETYKHGYIHKLITLGTPHKGSPFGPLLYYNNATINFFNKQTTIPGPLQILMKIFRNPIGLCHKDFDENGPVISNNLLQTLPYYTYAIGGDYIGSISDGFEYAYFSDLIFILSGKAHAELFHVLGCPNDEPENDIIVPMYSQIGGSKMGQIFPGTAHLAIFPYTGETSETNSPEIQTKVIQLLLSDDPSNFNPGFIKASDIKDDCDYPNITNRSSLSNNKKSSNVYRKTNTDGQNQMIQIIAPARGMILQQRNNTNITLQYQVLDGAIPSRAMFMVKNVGWFTAPTLPPYSISITLPDSVAIGNLSIALLARDTTGVIMADTSSIIITPNGNLDSISVNPGSIYLDSTLRVASFSVQGYYSGGTPYREGDITSGSAGTTYTSQKGNSIFKVSDDGAITAVSPGIDTLIISNSGKIVKLPVTVDSNFKYITLYTNGIDFPAIPDKIITDAPFVLVASDSSAEDVSFNLVSGPVTLQNGVVTITGTGTATIEAIAPGDAYFLDAIPVFRTFQITSALPLTLLDFYGSLNTNKEAVLNWQTTQEINTSYFDIEHSVDGNNFSSIGQVSASGNSASQKNYSYIDLNPLQGINYYRLKMVDVDGKFTYSKVISVKNNTNDNLFRVFPNPANKILNVQASGTNGIASLQIFDAGGRKLKEEKVVLNGNTSFSIDIKDLPKGVYNLLLKSKTKNEHQKFVKQ